MEAGRFVQPYPDRMTEEEIHRGSHAEYIRDAQDYSYKWGRVLHALLSDEEDMSAFEEIDVRGYARWVHDDFDVLHNDLHSLPIELRARALNETNFHFMNASLSDMWIPPSQGDWTSSAERVQALNGAEFDFAFHGLKFYAQRQKFIQESGGTHALFDPEIKEVHEALTGMMQEYDAALVLLDFIRKQPNLVLLPAPLQFERTRKRTNVDFLVVDFVQSRAVGVQVKSRLRQEDVAVADPERVVFIDGDADLGNVRLVRTQKARSTEKITAWPGIIAAKKMDTFKAHGKRVRQFSADPRMNQLIAQNPRALIEKKLLARSLVGDIKVYHEDIASTIGARILHKL